MKKWVVWVIAAVILVILIVGGIILYQWLTGRSSIKPEILLLQPTESASIQNTQGVLFITSSYSKIGIDRVEFLENSLLIGKTYPEIERANEVLAQFAWIPEKTGVHTLTFIAYDSKNTASEPAFITIGVISEGLSEMDAKNIIAEAENSAPVNISVSGGGGASEGARQAGNADEAGEEGGQADEELQFIQVDQDANRIRPLVSDLPPEIIAFETNLQREGNDVNAAVTVSAQDDVGVKNIHIVAYSDFNQEIPIALAFDCGGEVICSTNASAFLREATYKLVVMVEDTAGQTSSPRQKIIEVAPENEAGELPGIAEDSIGLVLSPEFIQGLLLHGNGLFELAPFPLLIGGFEDEIQQPDILDCQPNCPITGIEDVRVEVRQYYEEGWLPYLNVKMTIPPKLETDLEEPYIELENEDIFLWNLENKLFTHLTPEIYENGLVLETSKPMYYGRLPMQQIQLADCGNQTFSFTPTLRGKFDPPSSAQNGQTVTFDSLPCLPVKYTLVNLVVKSDCPENSRRCVAAGYMVVNDDGLRSIPLDDLVLKEKRFRGDLMQVQELIVQRFGQMYFEQTNDVQPNDVFEYELSASSDEYGLLYSSRMNIRVPEGDDLLYITNDWQENR